MSHDPLILHAVNSPGLRLDQFLQQELPQYSRARLQDWIRRGKVLVNEQPAKSSSLLKGTETVAVHPEALPALKAEPESLPLEVLYQDDDVIAVNKPAGMAVHAGAGRHSGTLVNALLHHFGTLSNVSGDDRPGIVHRLDKDTSGVLLVARHDAAHRNLAEQFAGRQVQKIYLALVQGKVASDSGRIDRPIARDPVHRTRMTVRLGRGRDAHTVYRVLERFEKFTFLEVAIGTGRTHQIRVHLASIGHPVAGDVLYGATRAEHSRFFLHALRIRFAQPLTREVKSVEAPLGDDLRVWLGSLRYNDGKGRFGTR